MNYLKALHKKKLATAIGLCTLATMSFSAVADMSVEQRMEMLEKELHALKAQLNTKETLQLTKGVEIKKGTRFQYGGFVKFDSMWSKQSDTQRANNVGDDFLVPSTIAVGDGSAKGETVMDSNAKFSRLWFKTNTDTDVGKVTSYVEMDFNAGNDERLTNQSSTGLRHAFLNWDYSDKSSLLVGQTWGTFFNVGALPEAVDFIGPTSGTLFNRQTQLRWTHKLDSGSLMLAAENSSSSVYDAGAGVEGNDFDDSAMPDLVARYNGKAGGLSYSVAAVAREIAYSDGVNDESKNGGAISVSGKYVFDNGDNFKFMLSQGTLGRYIALNAFRDAAVEADGSLDLIDTTGGFVAYQHHWSDTLRSTFMYAVSEADNPDGLVADVTEKVSNANVNLMYSPTKKLSFGMEYLYAKREVESGLDGDLKRVQLTGKWAF